MKHADREELARFRCVFSFITYRPDNLPPLLLPCIVDVALPPPSRSGEQAYIGTL